jgi:hypothetical protein
MLRPLVCDCFLTKTYEQQMMVHHGSREFSFAGIWATKLAGSCSQWR